MVPKVFEPLKFYCIYICISYLIYHSCFLILVSICRNRARGYKTFFMLNSTKPTNVFTYSRRLVAGTLMARLPRLFRTCSCVPWKNPIVADLRQFRVIFTFYIENGIIYVLISWGDSNENTQHTCTL